MPFKNITPEDLQYFRSIIEANRVLTDEDNLLRCASDHTEDFVFRPEIVIQPVNAAEISSVLKYCHEQSIPVTPRGAGTGLSGGALPVAGGVSLDMKRMNKILHLDKRNFQVMVEPGVITEELQNAVKAEGLFYPPDPASKGSCFIGGNISENSGGPKALKYGVVKDYVLNLEIVLPDGSIMWTGANVLKNATGYNLTQLVVGSEGTLCVITKIVLRLIPAVNYDMSMLVPFRNAIQACEAVNAIFMAGYTPSALEFMERDALEFAMRYVQSSAISVPDHIAAHLLIELDSNNQESLYTDAAAISELLQQYDIDEILLADSAQQKAELWSLRRKVGEAVKSNSVYKEEDTVVPRAELPELLKAVKELGRKYGFHSVCYGHAGDGNLHVNILKSSMNDYDWENLLPLGIRELFERVVSLGGTISGEHGIGFVQKKYIDIAFSESQLGLMKKIKEIFDPKGILNPGKIFA